MTEAILQDPFQSPTLPPGLRWHCEPKQWSIDPVARSLRMEPAAGTDFWQRTHYGFCADNGHFLHLPVRGDFVLTVYTRFRPVHQYDQSGVMVRVSPSCWLKASVEYEPAGSGRLGAVVTSFGYSDWSTQSFPGGPGAVWLRVRREGDDYIVDASGDGRAWDQIRMAHLHEGRGATVAAGLYACSPKDAGFVAEFTHFSVNAGRVG